MSSGYQSVMIGMRMREYDRKKGRIVAIGRAGDCMLTLVSPMTLDSGETRPGSKPTGAASKKQGIPKSLPNRWSQAVLILCQRTASPSINQCDRRNDRQVSPPAK